MAENVGKINVDVLKDSEETDVKLERVNMRCTSCHTSKLIKRLFVKNTQQNADLGDGSLV